MNAANQTARTNSGPCRFLFLACALGATAPLTGCGPAGDAPKNATGQSAAAPDETPTAPPSNPAPSTPTIQLTQAGDAHAFEVTGLTPADREALAERDGRWDGLLKVYVASSAGASPPPMLGSFALDDDVLRFTPRYPLRPGLTYRAVFDRSKLATAQDQDASEPFVAEFSIPQPDLPPTVLQRVYPGSATLPENQLKFYLEFSAPMTIGVAYNHIVLLDSAGEPVYAPFLELDEELWDPEGRRFTLFIDPGRIKREVKPREDLGPALLEGNRYTLVVSRDWPDAHGNPLAEEYRKDFEVGPPDHEQPDPATWQLTVPPAGTSEPLAVALPEPLDYGMLHRVFTVQTEAGELVDGRIQTEADETRWLFTPAQPWAPANYQLVVDTNIEDLAGNTIARPFEVDVQHPIEQQITTETVALPFSVEADESE